MESKVNYPAVGAFVVVLAAALVAITLWLASGGAYQQKFDLYRAISEESVGGLNLNAPVKYNGVEVGKVRQIQLAPGNPEQVNLLFAIVRGTPIKEDTVAVLKTQGLTGIAYVELSGGAHQSPLLRAAAGEDYPLIATKPSLASRLENVLTNVLAKLDGTSNSLNALLGPANQAAFSSLLADLASVAHTLAGRRDSIDTGLRDAAQAAGRLEPALERIGRAADAVDKMGQEVARTSIGAGRTIDAVGHDIQRFSTETLPELERLLGELSVLSTSLRRLTEQTERNPSSLLFGRRPVAPGPGEAPGAGPSP
ncbi:MAG: MCE family protein [Betaproteobacteria bacterium HGW-Betaproteobacteria-12]|nr:MAG: MCE family protein [Betaproteobacteria bacterium HGW-Betaproteobacteria-12]